MNDRCVYMHQLSDGRVFYIGMGAESRAFSQHNRNQHWKNIVKKYGNFKVVIIIKNLSIEQAAEIEKFWIAHIGIKKLTNISSGGEASAFGMRHTEETKRKISINSGSRRPEFKEKLRKAFSGSKNPMFGKTHSQKSKDAVSKARRNMRASPETKLKMSAKKRGEKNNAFKNNIYVFKNLNGKYFVGTQYHFRIEFKLLSCAVSQIISGKRKSHKGWSLVK